ncbi:hypothetical protein RHGRI_026557 [Rhododendron griersonianum]|uniref:Uncharacterized protein n=1 Tax=Rhododendron griersonianum TaxID=479676 RepID=A0AAV6IY94_9ERIC|nr:hypothetical protein RHGRI_026557 [Rhododendron griersonianum]
MYFPIYVQKTHSFENKPNRTILTIHLTIHRFKARFCDSHFDSYLFTIHIIDPNRFIPESNRILRFESGIVRFR